MAMPENIITVESEVKLHEVLTEHGVQTGTWGENGTRSASDLYEELRQGESALFLAAEGLRRYGASVKVEVFYTFGSHVLRLIEKRQFNRVTGTSRRRGLLNSLSEKRHVLHGESPYETALRGLREELRGPEGEERVADPLSLHLTRHKVWPAKEERNYPGLPVVNETDYFVAQLSPEQYDPSGYREQKIDEQGNIVRVTYFRWDRA